MEPLSWLLLKSLRMRRTNEAAPQLANMTSPHSRTHSIRSCVRLLRPVGMGPLSLLSLRYLRIQ